QAAVDECRSALPTAQREEAENLYRLLALSYAALGDNAGAEAAFTSLLALNPNAQLSSGYAPRMRELLENARRRNDAMPVSMKVAAEEETHPPTVRVEI